MPFFIILLQEIMFNIILDETSERGKKFSRVCTTSGYSCYTSGSFALSTWLHGRDVVTCERCVVIFLKTVKGVMFNINLTFCIVHIIYTFSQI